MQALFEENPDLALLSARELYPVAAQRGISRKEVDAYLAEQELTQVFKARKRYKSGKDGLRITAEPHSYMIDVVHMRSRKYPAAANSGITMFLLLVEITSRKAFAYLLKNNRMPTIVAAYKKFLDDVQMVRGVQGDDEFSAAEFVRLNEERRINLRTDTAKDDHITGYSNKLGIIDRLTRTLKRLFDKRRARTGSDRWVDSLDAILRLYNDKVHTSLKGNTPNEVFDDEDFMRGLHEGRRRHNEAAWGRVSVKVGDTVRVLKGRGRLDKEGAGWSKKLYTVVAQDGYRFQLRNEAGEGVPRLYKPGELQRVKSAPKGRLRKPSKTLARRQQAEERLRREGLEPRKPRKNVMARAYEGPSRVSTLDLFEDD